MKYEWHGNLYCNKDEDDRCFGQIEIVHLSSMESIYPTFILAKVSAGRSFITNSTFGKSEVDKAKKWVEENIPTVIDYEMKRYYQDAEDFKRVFAPEV